MIWGGKMLFTEDTLGDFLEKQVEIDPKGIL